MSRLASVALVLGAALADAGGSHALAFDLLLLAVPVTAFAGLRTVADQLDGKVAGTAAYLWAVVLGLLLIATAARAPAAGDPSVPAVSRSALIACIVVFCLQALGAVAAELRSSS